MTDGMILRRVRETIGPKSFETLRFASSGIQAGADASAVTAALAHPAFHDDLPAPVPSELRAQLAAGDLQGLARAIGAPSFPLGSLDFGKALGPFWRCWNVLVPEWIPLLEVPDITFGVTQDVNGDGVPVTIYAESIFDARWTSDPIPDIVLHASQIAIPSLSCTAPDVSCETQGIVTAGLYPLHNLPAPAEAYIDDAPADPQFGDARRPNKPVPAAPAATPFCGTLQLYGCNHQPGAAFYRVKYSFDGSSDVVFFNPWQLVRWTTFLEIRNVTPDGAGWYPIIDDADGWLPSHLLMNWPSAQAGQYRVHLEFADASKNYLGSATDSASVTLNVDNTSPVANFTSLSWRVAGSNAVPTPLELTCPVLTRAKNEAIEVIVGYTASAANLRDVSLSASGCGDGNPTSLAAPGWSYPPSSDNPYAHWYDAPTDNAVTATAVFTISGSLPDGAYNFHLQANSRAFNPAGGDGGFGVNWDYDVVYLYTPADLPLAVISA